MPQAPSKSRITPGKCRSAQELAFLDCCGTRNQPSRGRTALRVIVSFPIEGRGKSIGHRLRIEKRHPRMPAFCNRWIELLPGGGEP